MYIDDGIAYAGRKTPPIEVRSVRPLDGYQLWVRFNTDEIKIFDFAPLLGFPCYRQLNDKTVFDGVYVDFGIAVWNGGDIDISPERLYRDGVPLQ